MSAFEAITTRQALYAGEAISQYDAVMIGDDGTFYKADGSRPFVGMCEYGAEKAGQMVTVVRGIYPGLVSTEGLKGALLMVDTANPGKFVTATTGKVAVATLLEAATVDTLAAVMLLDNPVTAA